MNGEPKKNPNLRMVHWAKQYLGVHELGVNGGPEVEEIQKYVFGIADRQAYCIAFAQFLAGKVAAEFHIPSRMFKSGSVMQTWQRSPAEIKVHEPEPGDVMLWTTGPDHGHAGIFRNRLKGNLCETIEANTSSGEAGSQREGDGFYPRIRTVTGAPGFLVLGWIRCFPA